MGVRPPRLTYPEQGGHNAATETLSADGSSLSTFSHPIVLASQVAWITGESQFSRLRLTSLHTLTPSDMVDKWNSREAVNHEPDRTTPPPSLRRLSRCTKILLVLQYKSTGNKTHLRFEWYHL